MKSAIIITPRNKLIEFLFPDYEKQKLEKFREMINQAHACRKKDLTTHKN